MDNLTIICLCEAKNGHDLWYSVLCGAACMFLIGVGAGICRAVKLSVTISGADSSLCLCQGEYARDIWGVEACAVPADL